MTTETFTYEILCVDSASSSKVKTNEQFAYSLLSNSELWNNPKYNLKQHRIDDTKFSVTISNVDTKSAPDFAPQNSFRVSVVGQFDALEKARLPLITHVKKQDIPVVYVLTDEISEQIAQQIYPRINKVENRLRRYLIKFFATKLGSDWWRLTADSEMQFKAQQRRNNELVFSPHVDNKAYLIDFGELGKIVYIQSSGFINKEDIIKKVMSLGNDVESIIRLKEELQSNYTKYFKSTFKDRSFQEKWERVEKIRHKVAHNNLFTKEDLDQAIKLSEELIKIIEDADQKVDEVVFSKGEQEAIQEAIIESLVTTENEEASDWRTEVRNAIQALGGEADLSQIYDYVGKHPSRNLPTSWRDIIRWTLQVNSSDSPAYSGKADVFRRVSKGRWALRQGQE
jgi:hypothetical protein